MALRQDSGNNRSGEQVLGEESPLLRPMSPSSTGSLCTCSVIAVLAMSWCVLDFWNRKMSEDLFSVGDIRMADMSHGNTVATVEAPFKPFTYPLTLAFLQFTFMGIIFLAMYLMVAQQHPSDLRGLNLTSDKRWPVMVVSHVFSTFWLQSLMMPSQVMSLGFFASTRAVEIPAAAVMRPPLLGDRIGKKTVQTTAFAFGASLLLYFSYAQMEGCVCILSGHGVVLTGLAFWIVYALLLAMPAVNAVCQEAILTNPGMHPLMILALQNIFASLLFGPVLMLSHLLGWEDVGAAFQVILSQREIYMLVLWLCAQIALTSVVTIVLIQAVDSFWAVALRPLRVVCWGMVAFMKFYLTSSLALSVASPHSSLWCFVLLCGCGLAAAAIYTDRKAEDNIYNDKALTNDNFKVQKV
jgi:hypothetical protein